MPDFSDHVIEEDVVRVSPDLSGFRGKLERGLAFATANLKANVDVELNRQSLAGQTERLKKLATGWAREAASDRVRVDTAATRESERVEMASLRRRAAARKQLQGALTGPKIIDLGGRGIRPMNILYGTITALTPAIFAMGATAVQASTSIAALGTAGLGAATGLTSLFGAFYGLKDAMNLAQSARKASLTAKAPKAQVTNDNALRAARKGVAAANRGVAASERQLADAIKAEAKAQADVRDARKEALQDILDLREAVHDLNIEQGRANLDLLSAQERQRDVNRNFWSTDLERAQAAQDVLEAQEKVRDTTRERTQKTRELHTAERKGVNGSQKVIDAQAKVADAHQNVKDQQQALADAHDGVAEAAANLANVQKSQALAADGASAASAQLADQLARETQAFRDLFDYLQGPAKTAMDDYRHRMQRAILPATLQLLKDIGVGPKNKGTVFDLFTKSSERMGKTMARRAGDVGGIVKSDRFKGDFKTIEDQAEASFEHFSRAAVTLIKPMMSIFAASAPLLTRFATWIEEIATRFDKFIENKRKSGELANWFKAAGDEFATWVDLAKEVGRLLLPIFRESLPTGNNLVTRLRDFVKAGADWANSGTGRKEIADFFERFRTLDYAKIGKFFADMATMIVGFRTIKLGVKHPLVLFFTLLATIDMDLTAKAVDLMAGALVKVFTYATEHPGLVASIAAMFVAAKGLKSFNLGLKLPGVDNLKTYLVGKFSWLEKLTGLKSQTAVMHVTAGTVNINGGLGKGVGGGGGTDVITGGPGGKKGGILKKLGKGGAAAILLSLFGDEIIDAAIPETSGDGTTVKDRINAGLKGALAGGATLAMFGPAGLVIGGVGGGLAAAFEPEIKETISKIFGITTPKDHTQGTSPAKDALHTYLTYKDNPATQEASTFRGLARDQATGKNPIKQFTKDTIAGYKPLQDYIKARQANVKAGYDTIKAGEGEAEAAKWQQTENEKSRSTLAQLMTQYGWTCDEADRYATSVFGTAQEQAALTKQSPQDRATLDKNAAAFLGTAGQADGLTKSIFDIPKTPQILPDFDPVGTAAAKTQALKENIAQLIGVKTITVDLVPGSETDKKLEEYNIQQMALKNGGDFQLAKNQYEKDKRNALRGWADGGRISGNSAHSRADDILARVTANEWVMPVKSVQKYGPKMMTDIQTGAFPTFATGGLVGSKDRWPFFLGLPNIVDLLATGEAGDYSGKAYKGLGAIAGVNSNVVAGLLAAHKRFPAVHSISGKRHTMTVTGNPSLHNTGRAVDIVPPSMDLFNFLASMYPNSRELIYSPANGRQIWKGKPHVYSGPVRAQHFNHIHFAPFRDGGQVPVFDEGGVLAPGLNLVNNKTGAPEPLKPANSRLDPRDIALLAAHIARAVSGQHIRMNGRRVAETVQSYTYLPGTIR